MKKMLAAVVMALALTLTGCTTFTPISAGSGEIGEKKGSATAVQLFAPYGIDYLALMNFGNNSMLKAANRAEITKVATVDAKETRILWGLVIVKTTIVTGE